MLAIVVHQPGGPEVLSLEERPIPRPASGWVLVKIRAFGLNRSELVTRAGGSGDAVQFPRVLGIECAGEVVEAPGSDLRTGERVIAAMGGMGRDFDGGYQQYAALPASSVIPVQTTLDWTRLGAVPESFGTAWGSLDVLALERRQSLLIRGASSSVPAPRSTPWTRWRAPAAPASPGTSRTCGSLTPRSLTRAASASPSLATARV